MSPAARHRRPERRKKSAVQARGAEPGAQERLAPQIYRSRALPRDHEALLRPDFLRI